MEKVDHLPGRANRPEFAMLLRCQTVGFTRFAVIAVVSSDTEPTMSKLDAYRNNRRLNWMASSRPSRRIPRAAKDHMIAAQF